MSAVESPAEADWEVLERLASTFNPDCCEMLKMPHLDTCGQPAVGKFALSCEYWHKRKALFCAACVHRINSDEVLCVSCDKVGKFALVFLVGKE